MLDLNDGGAYQFGVERDTPHNHATDDRDVPVRRHLHVDADDEESNKSGEEDIYVPVSFLAGLVGSGVKRASVVAKKLQGSSTVYSDQFTRLQQSIGLTLCKKP